MKCQILPDQKEIENLIQKLKAQEKSHINQLQEMKVVTQKEKEELKQSFQLEIMQLEQKLQQERLYTAEQIEEIKITSRQEKERLEQLLESLRSENEQLKQQLAEPTKQHKDSLGKADSILSFLNHPEELDILVMNYNKNPRAVVSNIPRVGVIQASIEGIRSRKNLSIIFTTEVVNGIYTVLDKPSLKSDYYFLVPQAGLVINEIQYRNHVWVIFECVGYENKTSKHFKLLYPAVVKAISDEKWELVKPGKLEFE